MEVKRNELHESDPWPLVSAHVGLSLLTWHQFSRAGPGSGDWAHRTRAGEQCREQARSGQRRTPAARKPHVGGQVGAPTGRQGSSWISKRKPETSTTAREPKLQPVGSAVRHQPVAEQVLGVVTYQEATATSVVAGPDGSHAAPQLPNGDPSRHHDVRQVGAHLWKSPGARLAKRFPTGNSWGGARAALHAGPNPSVPVLEGRDPAVPRQQGRSGLQRSRPDAPERAAAAAPTPIRGGRLWGAQGKQCDQGRGAGARGSARRPPTSAAAGPREAGRPARRPPLKPARRTCGSAEAYRGPRRRRVAEVALPIPGAQLCGQSRIPSREGKAGGGRTPPRAPAPRPREHPTPAPAARPRARPAPARPPPARKDSQQPLHQQRLPDARGPQQQTHHGRRPQPAPVARRKSALRPALIG